MADLPVVCVFGAEGAEFRSEPPVPPFETDEMDCRCYRDDNRLYEVIAKDKPQVIVTVGDRESFKMIAAAPDSVKAKWIHFTSVPDAIANGYEVFRRFMNLVTEPQKSKPLVTVFTAAYKTGDKLVRPFNSLLSQTYQNWEWVVVDDSPDGDTFARLSEMAKKDFRVRAYRGTSHSGSIGEVKRTACDLGRGEYLVELDHDDELTPNALESVVEAYQAHPEVGFVYTDCTECFEGGEPVTYPMGWGMGYGSYRDEVIGGVAYKVINSPNLNDRTVRHIVAMPNHLRSWRKSVYDTIGGHNPLMHVVDDYELMIRTFLHTRMCRIPRLCYVQYRNRAGNTTFVRNREIQRLVRYVSTMYDKRIHERLLELGVEDNVWKKGECSFWKLTRLPKPDVESHCTILYNPKER